MLYYTGAHTRRGDEGQSPVRRSFRQMFIEQFVFTAAEALKELFAVDGLHLAAFQVVIPAVEHFARLRKLLQIAKHGVLNQLTRGAAGFRCQPVKFRRSGTIKWTN